MLQLLVCWALLFFACVGAGRWFDRGLTGWWSPFWAGLILLAWTFQSLSLLLPLSIWWLIPLLPLAWWGARGWVNPNAATPSDSTDSAGVNARRVAPILGALAVSWFIARWPIVWSDTGLYHYQTALWFNQHGVTWGLGLIHSRLATVSTWFPLLAPFADPAFGSTGIATWNGLLMAVLLAPLLAWPRRDATLADWARVGFCIWMLPFCLLFARSASPDLPAAAMVGVVACVWLDTRLPAASRQRLIVLLAAGALSLKLSAAMLLILLLPAMWQLRRSGWRLSLLVVGAAGLGAASALLLCGCLVFAVPSTCFEVDWGMGIAAMRAEQEMIRNWAIWAGPRPPQPTAWFGYWWSHEPLMRFLLPVNALALLVCLAGIWRWPDWRRPLAGIGGLALLGLAYTMLSAPSFRFGLGYLGLLPALALAVVVRIAMLRRMVETPWAGYTVGLGALAMPLVATWLEISPYLQVAPRLLTQVSSLRGEYAWWWQPAPVTRLKMEFSAGYGKLDVTIPTLHPALVNDVSYVYPDGGQCWDARLPCAIEPLSGIRLRDPAAGPGGGFVRVKP